MSGKAQRGGAGQRGPALLVLSLGLIVTAALWLLVRRHEERDVRWAAHFAAQALRADIIADLESEVTGLTRLSLLAERINSAEPFWSENAELYMHRRAGCIAIELLTPERQPISIVYAAGETKKAPLAHGGIPLDLLQRAADSQTPVIGPSVAVQGSTRQRAIVAAIEAHGEPGGFVVAFFDVAKSFDRILADVKGLGYSMAILEGGQERYRMTRDKEEPYAQRLWTETTELTIPDVTWQLRVWPQAASLHAMDAKLPELTLLAGALMSLLLGSTVYFSRSASARAQALRRLNTDLIGLNSELLQEIHRREQAEDGLRCAQEELEARVQQRTTELSAANTKLEHEAAEHARAERALQQLAGRLFRLQDDERRRLARELHDGVTQNLIAISMNIATLRSQAISGDERTELLDDSVRLIQQSVGELRTTAHLLHPPLIDELGLPVTLRSYVDGFSTRSGIHVSLVLDPQLRRLNRDVELGIFRVVQESLANVRRHSHSDTARILLCRNDTHVRLEITDSGTGISPDILARTEHGISGVGIAGMRERVRLLGGSFELDSSNTGTIIRVALPTATAEHMEARAGAAR